MARTSNYKPKLYSILYPRSQSSHSKPLHRSVVRGFLRLLTASSPWMSHEKDMIGSDALGLSLGLVVDGTRRILAPAGGMPSHWRSPKRRRLGPRPAQPLLRSSKWSSWGSGFLRELRSLASSRISYSMHSVNPQLPPALYSLLHVVACCKGGLHCTRLLEANGQYHFGGGALLTMPVLNEFVVVCAVCGCYILL